MYPGHAERSASGKTMGMARRAFDYADRALLEKGWHIAYMMISDMYGCPESISLMEMFYQYITEEEGLNKKADLFGFSRGGLYSVNYTVKKS